MYIKIAGYRLPFGPESSVLQRAVKNLKTETYKTATLTVKLMSVYHVRTQTERA